jgi:hypothetical protein
LPRLDDPEGPRVPDGLPPVIDAHVHVFPEELFSAIWHWFDHHGWPIRYRMGAEDIIAFLQKRGLAHLVVCAYAHKPGVARSLNACTAGLCRRHGAVTGLATVFPGEQDAEAILEEGFAAGLAGVKLHAHVQCFAMDSEALQGVCRVCERHDRPLMMHVGREPKSEAYPCDPYAICGAGKLEVLLRDHPRLRVCVPHLGADEFAAFAGLIERYDNLWLDTAMVLAEYLPGTQGFDLSGWRSDRVMYGTDFPNIPYAWDRELKRLAAMGLKAETLERVLGGNARRFYGIDDAPHPGGRR